MLFNLFLNVLKNFLKFYKFSVIFYIISFIFIKNISNFYNSLIFLFFILKYFLWIWLKIFEKFYISLQILYKFFKIYKSFTKNFGWVYLTHLCVTPSITHPTPGDVSLKSNSRKAKYLHGTRSTDEKLNEWDPIVPFIRARSTEHGCKPIVAQISTFPF